jgi:DNA invertase Pin-like site-specific DNA recombinase
MSRSTTLRALLADSPRELSALADRSGWEIWKVYEDAGISGAKGRDQRPGLEAMMKAVNAREFDMVAAWSVDRLGRSLTDMLGILQDLHEKGGPVSSPAGARYLDDRREGDVPNAGCIRRVRAGHHSGTGQRWPRAREQGVQNSAGALLNLR